MFLIPADITELFRKVGRRTFNFIHYRGDFIHRRMRQCHSWCHLVRDMFILSEEQVDGVLCESQCVSLFVCVCVVILRQ